MFDKHTRKIYQSTKETTVIAQASLGIFPQKIIKGVRIFRWDVLLQNPEDCMSEISLKVKDLIFRMEYKSTQNIRVTVYEVHPHVKCRSWLFILNSSTKL